MPSSSRKMEIFWPLGVAEVRSSIVGGWEEEDDDIVGYVLSVAGNGLVEF